MMEFSTDYEAEADAIAALFAATFTASEGAREGALIGDLARRLLADTPPGDLRVFTAWQRGAPVGGVIFSRLVHAGDARCVFLLSPMAVATHRQGEGIGQRLIAQGLGALRREGVDIAVTYGDPAFYARAGFVPVTQKDVPAPFALQHPEGWLGQSLRAGDPAPLVGPARCVPALADPAFW